MKSDETYIELPSIPEDQSQEQSIEFSLDDTTKDQLKRQRIEQVLADLDKTYQIELNKLAELSLKFHQKVEESKTKTKDQYYASKLQKNNEKIYDMLIQYESSRKLIVEYLNKLDESGEQPDAEPSAV